jgi:5-formaminoimidazole-4-carboxamide-1-(beta)-D-ribofuranosyl 5'-monophosphate synthetase
MFGNKKLLRIEERGFKPNQYDLLETANIRFPKQFKNPKDIDRPCLVKVLEKERGFERAFFLAESYNHYQQQVEKRLKEGQFTKEQLEKAVIEEFVVGVQVNFNFFYSPLSKRLELLGTDTRRQTNLEGINKLPATYQNEILKKINISYEEAGHIAVTVLESMLEQAFEMGERFVEACKKFVAPGVIGPFALQSIIIPGPPKKDIVVIDVSPRVPGSPGIAATPYSKYLFGETLSVGKRIAMEIKEAINNDALEEIIS